MNQADYSKGLRQAAANEEEYVCQLHCMQCKKMLKQANPVPEGQFRQMWGDIFVSSGQVAADIQRSINCPCFNGQTGRGGEVKLAIWARKARQWCSVIMRNPAIRDFSLVRIVKGINTDI